MGGRHRRKGARGHRPKTTTTAEPSRSASSEHGGSVQQNGTNSAVLLDEGIFSEASSSVYTQTGDAHSAVVADLAADMTRLSASARLETMAQVLYTLTPLEIRFIGACLENVARKDSQNLRDWEERLNNVETVRHLAATCDTASMLSMAAIGITVLHSTNRRTAVVFADFLRKVSRTMEQLIELQALDKRVAFIEQLRLLFTAATHHPAFMMEQRLEMEKARLQLDQLTSLFTPQPPTRSCSSIASSSSTAIITSKTHPIPLYVLSVDVDDPSDDDSADLCCQVTWIDRMQTFCAKSLEDVRDFHYRLLDAFPMEAGYQGAGRLIPYLSRIKSHDLTPSHFAQYLRHLSDLPARMLLSSVVTDFFLSSRTSLSGAAASSTAASLSSLTSSLPSATLPVEAPAVSDDTAVAPPAELFVRLSSARPSTCPNCAQTGHVFAECTQPSLHEIAATGDFKLNWRETADGGQCSHKRHSSASARVPSRMPPLLLAPDTR